MEEEASLEAVEVTVGEYFYYIPHDLSMPKLKTLTLNEERVSRLC